MAIELLRYAGDPRSGRWERFSCEGSVVHFGSAPKAGKNWCRVAVGRGAILTLAFG